jgi:hypothetical protein
MRRGTQRLTRPLIIAAAAALGVSGIFVPPSAFADTPTDAPLSGSAYENQAKTLLQDPTVQAVGKDANGNVVVVKTPGAGGQDLSAFSSAYDNVVIQQVAAPLTSQASNDVVGGAGYAAAVDLSTANDITLCSVGFTAWTPTGGPAVLSAGHCANDASGAPSNVQTALTLPTDDTAGGAGPSDPPGLTTALGTFGFNQFGGPGNTPGDDANPSTDDIDVSAIDVSNPSLTLQPAVTDWTTAASEDLSTSSTTITSVGPPVLGGAVAKSGRTTGQTTSTIDVGDGWAKISGQLVYGFGSDGLLSDHGDSGGAVYQGGTAVGLVSGGAPASGDEPEFTWASDLQNDLAHTGGYTVRLALPAPTVTSSANGSAIGAGSTISGTAPANTTVLVTPEGGTTQSVTADGSGNWSTTAPTALGAFGLSVQAEAGYNVSATNSYQFTVKPAPPIFTSPAFEDQQFTLDTEVAGTGLAGALVTVTGAFTGTTTVGADGTWSLPTNLGYGSVEAISATQTVDGLTSDPASTAFVLLPHFGLDSPIEESTVLSSSPVVFSGEGVDGAIVTVELPNNVLGTATVVDGKWSISVNLQAGNYTFNIAQQIDNSDNGMELDLNVVDPTITSAPASTDSGSRATSAGSGTALADTGSDVTGASLLGALLIAAGLGATIVVRRRRSVRD